MRFIAAAAVLFLAACDGDPEPKPPRPGWELSNGEPLFGDFYADEDGYEVRVNAEAGVATVTRGDKTVAYYLGTVRAVRNEPTR